MHPGGVHIGPGACLISPDFPEQITQTAGENTIHQIALNGQSNCFRKKDAIRRCCNRSSTSRFDFSKPFQTIAVVAAQNKANRCLAEGIGDGGHQEVCRFQVGIFFRLCCREGDGITLSFQGKALLCGGQVAGTGLQRLTAARASPGPG